MFRARKEVGAQLGVGRAQAEHEGGLHLGEELVPHQGRVGVELVHEREEGRVQLGGGHLVELHHLQQQVGALLG